MKTKKNNIIKLNANENFYGCSKKVLKSIKENSNSASYYPNYTPEKLENIIAKKHNINTTQVAVGAGSVRIIDGILQSLIKQNEEIILFENSFIAYYQLADIHNIKYKLAKQTNYKCELKNILPLINKKTKAVFIANPNNPTGTIITHQELKDFLKAIPKNIFVIIDEAYIEFVSNKHVANPLSLLKGNKNLIIIRTFSKAYGLAGLRVGYVIANEELIDVLKNNRIPFTINYLAEKAAITALSDNTFLMQSVIKNANERAYLYSELLKNGYAVVPSEANFIYVHIDDEKKKDAIVECLKKRNILICNLKIFGQEKSLRIGIGNRKINKEIISCF
jgi:histidinol-phosphate aminotransferase